MKKEQNSYKRNGKIDFLRFVFCFIIVLTHSSTFAPESLKYLFEIRGALSVEFFFLVSGYLMAVSALRYSNKDVGVDTVNFIRRKICSLMPNFLIAWMLGFILLLLRYKNFSIHFILRKFLDCIWELLFLSMAGFGQGNVNGVDWYISAMLLSMAILYPVCKKHFSYFTRVLAPAIAIFILGFFSYNYESMLQKDLYIGFVYKGLLRAIAMISLGASCYNVVSVLKRKNMTYIGKFILSILESSCYLVSIVYMAIANRTSKYDFIIVLLLMLGVCFSFSHQGLLSNLFDNRVCVFLGKYSLSLYLGHLFWGRLLGEWYKDEAYFTLLIIYLLVSLTTGFFIYFLSNFLKSKYRASIADGLKNLLFVKES